MAKIENRFGTGIPTFMGGDAVTEVSRTAEYDIAFLGIPYEGGASYRRGQSRAPATLRTFSDWDRIDGSSYVDLNRDEQPLTAHDDRVADLGDLRLDESSPEATIEQIIRVTGSIATSCLPVLVGGDHSITYSTFQGARSRLSSTTRTAILHFDAHFDVEGSYPGMPRIWHGNPFRQLIEEGHIQGRDLFTIGVRGIVPEEWVDYARHTGINYFPADNINRSKRDVLARVRSGLEKYDAVYLTFDVDSLDIAYAPGTGTPTSNGLAPRDITDFTRSIEQPLAGIDAVEYLPSCDNSGQTAVTICEMLFDFLAFRRHK